MIVMEQKDEMCVCVCVCVGCVWCVWCVCVCVCVCVLLCEIGREHSCALVSLYSRASCVVSHLPSISPHSPYTRRSPSGVCACVCVCRLCRVCCVCVSMCVCV